LIPEITEAQIQAAVEYLESHDLLEDCTVLLGDWRHIWTESKMALPACECRFASGFAHEQRSPFPFMLEHIRAGEPFQGDIQLWDS